MLNRTILGKTFDLVNVLVLAVIAATMLFPFVYIASISFASFSEFLRSDLILWPKDWSANAYIYVLSSKAFIHSIGVTVFITVVGTLTNLVFTSTMAYGLTRPVRGRKLLLFMVLFTVLFSAGLIPTYLVVKATGLINSLWALILPVAISPFNLIVMRQFFLSIPVELNEAAVIDGANDLQIYWRVILPLSKPALAAFGLFYAVGHWNSYFSGLLYENDPEKWPLQVVLRQIVVLNQATATLQQQQQIHMQHVPPPQTIQMAAIIVATVPILIVYPFLQKHFVKGVMIGSIKG